MATSSADAEPASVWRNWDFRLFFAGQFVTNLGDSLYTVAVLWLVYDLSGSTVLSGVASSLLLLPWLLQLFAGPLVDRLPLKPVLVSAQLVQGAVVLVLPLAAITGRLSVGVLFAVIPVLTLAATLMSPMQSAVLPRIVVEDRLSSANSALATVTLGLDMLFDALGGIVIAIFGVTVLFVFDSITFAVAALLFGKITALSADTAKQERETETTDPLLATYVSDLRVGFDALRGTVFVELVALTAIVNFATGMTLAILPSFGSLLSGAAVYGLLLGALGTGRLIGSVIAPWFEHVGYGRITFVTYLTSACVWLVAVFVPSTALTIVLFGLAWIPPGVNSVLTATLNQTVFPTELLGRVTSLKGTASGGTLPLGSLVGGVVAAVIGTTPTMAVAALGFGLAGLYVLARPRLRQLPAVADADLDDFTVPTTNDQTAP
ncbi:macrolide-efflux protein / Permease [Natrialba hulunbeirensis JCM 10989]|uniref:Macrolide-efflux protein / Permease n=1 Tax=Natrialba hulunbeirensis JCM 10989 TaxID=1227493 RepID=L9ZMS0_9EURY|nr:MFS transporter [Natrialba hulunbeirensis]ELY87654.1 macrolide-efflux protein / Permease [Natrialba hulunbeirensis JCM 10989]